MSDQNGNGDRRRNGWTSHVPLGLAVIAAAIAYGAMQNRVDGHDRQFVDQGDRIKTIEQTYVRERDLSAISGPLNDRLRRIESQLDQLIQRGIRPVQP